MDPAPISIRFVNELDDHLEARRVLYKEGVMAKVDKVVAVLLFGFGILSIASAGLLWWTVVWFPLALAEWFDLLTLSRWRTRVEFRRNPKFRDEYHLTFTPDHIHFRTASIDSTVQWTHYERVVESPDLFLLMYGSGLYTMVPKRCFSSKDALNSFRALLGRAIGREPPGAG